MNYEEAARFIETATADEAPHTREHEVLVTSNELGAVLDAIVNKPNTVLNSVAVTPYVRVGRPEYSVKWQVVYNPWNIDGTA